MTQPEIVPRPLREEYHNHNEYKRVLDRHKDSVALALYRAMEDQQCRNLFAGGVNACECIRCATLARVREAGYTGERDE